MALPMVHLGAAEAARKYLEINSLPSYYLGAIAPDGVHIWAPGAAAIQHQWRNSWGGCRSSRIGTMPWDMLCIS